MSRPTELNLDGLPTGVAVYIATHRLADDGASAVVDFVRGTQPALPSGLASLSMTMEGWRGEYLGHLASKREVCDIQPPKPEIARIHAAYGLDGVSARTFVLAYEAAALGRAVI
jgi:hypothetical protein